MNGIEHIEYLPVMDYRNASIFADKVTSFDVNKAIQRSLTKALARHGLGLYIYAGEDLPEEERADAPAVDLSAQMVKPVKTEVVEFFCEECGGQVSPYPIGNGQWVSVKRHVDRSKERFGKVFCLTCAKAAEKKAAKAE